MVARIGAFALTSDTLFASDPLCLNCASQRAQIDRCIPGTWDAWVQISGHEPQGLYQAPQVCVLAVFHESCPLERETTLEQTATSNFGEPPDGFEEVCSGIHLGASTCGFFDSALAGPDLQFQAGKIAYLCEKQIGLEPPCSTVLPGAAAAEVWAEDSLYCCFVHRGAEGKADAAMLRFLRGGRPW